MPDQDKALQIGINITKTGEGGTEAKADLKGVTDAAGEAGRGTEKLADGMNEGAAAAEKAAIPHRELRHVLSDIGNTVAPGAGRALGELAFGPLGAALALLSVFESVKKSLEDASTAADTLSTSLAMPDTSGINGVKTAWDDATKAYGEYVAKLATAGKDNDPIKTEIERAKELTLARLEAQKKIEEAMGDKAGAEYTQRSIDLTKGSSSLIAEQDAREKAQSKLEADSAARANEARAADKKFADDQAKLKSDREATDPNSAAGKALQKKIDAAADKVDAATSSPDETISYAGGPAVDRRKEKAQAISDAQAELSAAQRELDNRKKEQSQLESDESLRVAQKSAADAAATAADDASEKNKGRLTQLPGEIKQDTATEAIKQHSDKVVEILNTHGGALNETLAQLAAETGKTQQQTLNIVESILDGHFTAQRRIAQLEAQLASSRGWQGGQG